MRRSRNWAGILFLVAAAACWAPVALAGSPVMDIDLGESFTGTISTAGVDTVQARFLAGAGAVLRVNVRADEGVTLQPTVVVRNGAGTPIAGTTETFSWLPVNNAVFYATVPSAGSYTATIGGASGSGGFWARVTGSGGGPVNDLPSAVSGRVTSSAGGAGIAGANVSVDGDPFAVTNATGNYTGELDPDTYSVLFEADGYESSTLPLTVLSATPVVLNAVLTPVAAPTLATDLSGDAEFGGELTATVTVPEGLTVESVTFTRIHGAPVEISGTGLERTITLGSEADYRDELILLLSEPPIGEDELPENVPLPEGEFPGGLQNRLQVVGINPFALEEAALVIIEVEVETDMGTLTDEIEIHAELPWKVATGLRNVAQGIPVLLRAKAPEIDRGGAYFWTLDGPPGSTAELTDPTSRHPYFTPDVPGLYELEVSEGDITRGIPVADTLEVYVGTWRGTIVDQLDGRPVSDTACTFCHNGDDASDTFTPWAETGHAEIFSANLDTSTHYGERCFACHTVGYDPEVDNGGIDEAELYEEFLGAGLINNPGDNWTTVLADFPEVARLANAQCETCHGPQNTNAHFGGALGEPRASLSSDVCATCHGEPLRHARFQQWQLSGHANYELAIDESDSGSCSRCHTGNGFLAWLPILMDDDPETDPLEDIEVTWEPDEAHPQTCVVCHDPHMSGTTSGNNTNATVRISGDTPPLVAGFTATDVGAGAICMTCHNSRRGLRNDEVFDEVSQSDRTRGPHGSAQADMLMGQNAYFVSVPMAGGHAEIEDTCVECHMKTTPPPDQLAYNLGGLNHTFYAEKTICADCHSQNLLASDVQNGIQNQLNIVEDLIKDSVIEWMDDTINAGNVIEIGDVTVTNVNNIAELEFGEARGRQAFGVTMVGGEESGLVSVASIDSVGTTNGSLDELIDPAVLQAGWNWILVHNDGSLGVHNPFFANSVLMGARDALLDLSGAGETSRAREALISPTGRVPELRKTLKQLDRR